MAALRDVGAERRCSRCFRAAKTYMSPCLLRAYRMRNSTFVQLYLPAALTVRFSSRFQSFIISSFVTTSQQRRDYQESIRNDEQVNKMFASYPLPPQQSHYGSAYRQSSYDSTKKPSKKPFSRRTSSYKDIEDETKRNTRLNSMPSTYSDDEETSAATPSIRTTRTISTTSTLSSTKSRNPLKELEKSGSRTSRKNWLKRVFSSSSSTPTSAEEYEEDAAVKEKERRAMWKSMSMGYANYGVPWV